jgi:RNA polymerase sigma factor (sigma-70 family)
MAQENLSLSIIPAPDPMSALIRRAAEGDLRAMRQLVTALTPVIRTSVASVLSRSGNSGRREARQEVEDATQTVLLALFADRGRVLLQWDPGRGLSLPSFVALLARRETVSLLRSRRRSPWTEDPTLNEDLDLNAVPRMGPESETISRDMLANLAVAVREKLSARGMELFEMIFMRGLPPEEVATLTGMTSEAVYTWKSRLTRQVKEILAELAAGPPSAPLVPRIGDTNPGLRDPALETMVRVRRDRLTGAVTPAEPASAGTEDPQGSAAAKRASRRGGAA